MSSEIDAENEVIERGRLLKLTTKEVDQYGRGRLLQMSQMRHSANIPTNQEGQQRPRSILVLRQNGVAPEESSDEFDSESSILFSKQPQPSRMKNQITAKKATFSQEAVLARSSQNNDGSIKSASSYDASKISFQGKRALFEAGLPNRSENGRVVRSSEQSMTTESNNQVGSSLSLLEEKNLKLEQDIVRLEQAAALREEVARRLRDKLEKVEMELGEKDRSLQADIMRLTRENSQKEELIKELDQSLESLNQKFSHFSIVEKKQQEDMMKGFLTCKHQSLGCDFIVPNVRDHEAHECSFRPTRCPSLTCQDWPAAAMMSDHLDTVHDGSVRGKDVVVRTGSNILVSSYVNVDREPIFYKKTSTTWVANELQYGNDLFYMECIREPPEWFLWVWHLGLGQFVANIRLFRVGEEREMGAEERSWTGSVIPLRVSKDDITSGRSLGFMLHDRQIQPLCGPIQDNEEQLFGYEVTISYDKRK